MERRKISDGWFLDKEADNSIDGGGNVKYKG